MSGWTARREALTVVKLGGSFAFSPHLPGILGALNAAHAPVVVVAGGGPFADAVREAQPRMGFNDSAAHSMALMAMGQFAEALATLAPRLVVASSLAAIRTALSRGRVPIWSPWPIADGVEALPESWQLTSDSLAAWLAGKLGASRLVMLKQGEPPAHTQSFGVAAEAGVVDPFFPDYAKASRAAVLWLWPAQLGSLADVLGERASASV
jgi:aspartokinase-like uncharacterized kinase